MRPTVPAALRGRLLLATVALTLLAALGCWKPADLPATHAVSGQVVYTDGQPLNGGTIQFVAFPHNPLLTVIGAIENNGHFTLNTLKGERKVAGAVEGQYQVTIIPPLPDNHQPVLPITLRGAYTVKPGENSFPTLKIPRPLRPAAPAPRR